MNSTGWQRLSQSTPTFDCRLARSGSVRFASIGPRHGLLDPAHLLRSLLQQEFPRLSDEIMTKTAVRLLVSQTVSARFVNSTGASQYAIGPQDNFPVTRLAGETLALPDQTAADAQSARFGLDEKQP